MKIHVPGVQTFIFGRYGSLLVGLLLLMVLQPAVDTTVGRYLLEALFITVLFAGLRAIGVNRRLLAFEVVLLVCSLALNAAGLLTVYHDLFFLGIAGRTLFMVLVALAILMDLFRSSKVSGDSLAGAVCVYLLTAIISAYGFLLIEYMVPGSFSFTLGHARMQLWISQEFYPFFYFSLVTMTTVGYGDMAPVTTAAQTFATLEALAGQIYLTILVARLVGMYLVDQQRKEEQE